MRSDMYSKISWWNLLCAQKQHFGTDVQCTQISGTVSLCQKKKVNKKVVSLLPWPWSRLLLFLPKMRARTHNRIVRHTHTNAHTHPQVQLHFVFFSFFFFEISAFFANFTLRLSLAGPCCYLACSCNCSCSRRYKWLGQSSTAQEEQERQRYRLTTWNKVCGSNILMHLLCFRTNPGRLGFRQVLVDLNPEYYSPAQSSCCETCLDLFNTGMWMHPRDQGTKTGCEPNQIGT